ncbi:hypothetical protein HIM_03311 [Hirsutella minnesotensis 3608]|uniref:Vacuolar sorting protein Vps3844 C-terminal domain-containing protein n=1 Tax=Hirsutella minnesotensis 3608 TaxID=1043627 RepID=A0A0F7ZQC1_9HYPO|nr:hypothetical protein HIM_03311 [Hirsutella minnesotensis 3608]
MKVSAGLIAVSCGLAVAAQPVAQVFVLSTRPTAPSASFLSPGLARLVLLQRLALGGRGPSLDSFPKDATVDEAVSSLQQFANVTLPLFHKDANQGPRQLLMMLEGLSPKQIQDVGHTLGMKPAFSITDPPSSKAHEELVQIDLAGTGATNAADCDVQQVANPLESCWNGAHSAYAKFDDSGVFDQVVRRLSQLSQLSKNGEVETTLVLLPSSKNTRTWSDQPVELRRRQAERVMTSLDQPERPVVPTSPAAPNMALFASKRDYKSCYDDKDSCITATGNCSAHGECRDRWAGPDGATSGSPCFACHCMSTRNETTGSLTHWAGPACAQKDVSVAFWLFAGFTLALVGILWMAISLLFSVGEERLPGVIGAGVSRSK